MIFPRARKVYASAINLQKWDLPFLLVCLGPFILYFRPLITGEVLYWGLPALQFIPWRIFAWQNLVSGVFPLWNPFNGMGAPLIANYQLALFYPPGWLVYLAASLKGVSGVAWMQTLLVPIHLAWAGAGMVCLMRRFNLGELAQIVSGLAFSLGGYFVARSGFYSMIWAGAWLPWLVWAASQISAPIRIANENRSFIPTMLVAVLVCQLLAGHAQLTWYSGLLTGLWVLAGGYIQARWRGLISSFFRYACAVLVSISLSAIQLVPTLEYLLQSQRSSAVDFEMGLTYSFWPWRFLTFLMPDLFGNPGRGNYFGYASFWEDAVYIGVFPFFLAVTTLIWLFKRKSMQSNPLWPMVCWSWSIIMVGIVFALGKNLPVFPFFYDNILTFNLFNAPARWMIWVVFGLSILSGIGAISFHRLTKRALQRFKLLTLGAFAITIGAGATWLFVRDVQITFIQSMALFGFWAVGACLLVLKKPSGAQVSAQWRWQWAVSLWILADLLASGWCLQPTIPTIFFDQSDDALAFAPEGGRIYMDAANEYDFKFKRFFRFSDYQPIEDNQKLRAVALPNMNLLPGSQFAMVNNFDPFVPQRFSIWLKLVDGLPQKARNHLLSLMNVSYVLRKDENSTIGLDMQKVEPLGRARFLSCFVSVKNEREALGLVTNKATIETSNWFANHAIVETDSTSNESTCQVAESYPVEIIENQPDHIAINVSAASRGVLLLADVWYPGWTAMVDGVPAPNLRVDYLFMGVEISTGNHKIDFVYRPLSFYMGAGISGLSLLIMLLSIEIRRRHKRT